MNLWIVAWEISVFLLLWGDTLSYVSSSDARCDDQWVHLHRACYLFSNTVTHTWNEAQQACEAKGGQLISISSLSEMRAIRKMLRATSPREKWWIGLRKEGMSWQWLDRAPFSVKITKWEVTEPNNKGGFELCVEIGQQATLNDRACNSHRPFICEKQPNPPPSLPGTTTTVTQKGRDVTQTRNDVTSPRTVTSQVNDVTHTRKDATSSSTYTTQPTKSVIQTRTDAAQTGNDVTQSRNDVIPTRTDATTTGNDATHSGNDVTPTRNDDIPTGNDITQAVNDVTQTTIDAKPTVNDATEAGNNVTETSKIVIDKLDVSPGPSEENLFDMYSGCFMLTPQREGRQAPFLYTPHSHTCPSVKASGITWPQTPHGVVYTFPCRQGHGNMTFKCSGNPTCWQGTPNVDQCASPLFRDLLSMFTEHDGFKRTLSPELTVSMTSELANVTEGGNVTGADIAATSKVIQQLALSGAIEQVRDENEMETIAINVLRAGSNVLSESMRHVWKNMAPHDRVRSATSLLVALETGALAMAESLTRPMAISTRDQGMELELRVMNVSSMRSGEVVFAAQNSDLLVSIPTSTLHHLSWDNLVKTVFMAYYTVGQFLGDDLDAGSRKGGGNDVTETFTAQKLASDVISMSVAGKVEHTFLPKPVEFTMSHVEPVPEGYTTLCSFWKIDDSGLGWWSQAGCQVVDTNSSHTRCQCDHMTNFAILMAVNDVQLSEQHVWSLRVVTIVGCAISCVCLLASWVTFTCFTSLQGERNSIHKNLVATLFIAEMLFVTGISQTEHRAVCGVIAGFLHYFFLVAFMWMLMEGVYIMLMLVQVFDPTRSRLPYFYTASYATPAVIIAVSAGLRHHGYGTDSYCWLTTEGGLIWSFTGPVCAILAVNTVILGYALTMVCRHSESVFNSKEKDKSSAESISSWIRGALGLEVVLGVTWIVGLVFLNSQLVAVAYIFTVLNSTQGLFIFLFYCLLNKKAQKEYQRVLRARIQSDIVTTTSSKVKLTSASPPNKQGTAVPLSASV